MSAPRFRLGDYVQKRAGSYWRGKVVGTYATELTLRGYVIESAFERGHVQPLPEGALEPWTPPRQVGRLTPDEEKARAEEMEWNLRAARQILHGLVDEMPHVPGTRLGDQISHARHFLKVPIPAREPTPPTG